MGRTSKPLTWLVHPLLAPALQDLADKGHQVATLEVGLPFDVILSPTAWYCKDVDMWMKHQKIIIEMARERRYGKGGV